MEFNEVNCNLCGSNNFVPLKVTKQYRFGRCRECGLLYVNPMPKIVNEIASSFYHDYKRYNNLRKLAKRRDYLELHRIAFEQKIKNVEKLVGRGTITRFLDIGCGEGWYVKVAQEKGYESHGVQIDKEACLFAKQELGVSVFNGILEQANFNDDYFDIIQIKQVLEHVFVPMALLREISRITKNRGIVILEVPNQKGLIPKAKILFRLREDEYGFLQPPRHLYAYSSDTLKAMLNKSGLNVVKEVVTVPGDKVYYPLIKQGLLRRVIFAIIKSIH